MRRLGIPLCLLAAALVPASASAGFDPPNGTVIQANLPTNVSLFYSIDVEALCGAGVAAGVTAVLQDPSGAQSSPSGTRNAIGLDEHTFGVDMTEYGLYRHWVVVACAGTTGERRVEEGTFTIGGGDPESVPPGQGGPNGGKGGGDGGGSTTGTAPGARACKRATTGLERARTKLRKAKRALGRKDTVKRRRAVRKASKAVKTARKRKGTHCP